MQYNVNVIISIVDSSSDFTLIRPAACSFTVDNCMNEYYILANETHIAIAVVSEQGRQLRAGAHQILYIYIIMCATSST